jgi:hypothetical protein
VSTARRELVRYSEGVVWTAALVGVPAWIVHLVFVASMAHFTTTHPGWRWSLHVATAITALVTLAGMAICFDLFRTASDAGPSGAESDAASPMVLSRFLGAFGLILGAANLALILGEGAYVIFVRRGG